MLGRSLINARVVIRSFQTNRPLIVTWKPTRSEPPSAPSLVVRVAKDSTTAHPSMLMFVPRIQLLSPLQLTENDPPLKPQTHHQRRNPKQQTSRIHLMHHPPQLTLKRPLLLVLAGKKIQYLSLQTMCQALTRILSKCTGNIGHRFVPGLAEETACKTGIIFASRRSVQFPSSNNSAASSLISLQSSK